MSKSGKPPLGSKSPLGGQFKATNIWKDLVGHLYDNANIKRRRVMMKSHNDCFSGGNAVDTLLRYVRANPNRFPNTTMVARENICRLCQSFMDANVFECINAGEDSEKKTKFEDSASRLYRFNPDSQSSMVVVGDHKVTESTHNTIKRNGLPSPSYAKSLPTKFQFLSTAPQGADMAVKQREAFSPFVFRGRKKSTSVNGKICTGSSCTSDSDSENIRPKSLTRKSPRLKRRASFVGMVMRRSSSDPSMIKEHSTGSSSESEYKQQSLGDHLPTSMMRLSERLSFRKKSLRRSSQSTYQLQQASVIQNLAAGEEPCSLQGNAILRRDPKRRSAKSIIPNDDCSKIKVLSRKPIERKLTRREESHVKRESVRVRLLQLLDLPFIETLVISPVFDKKMFLPTDDDQMARFNRMNYGEIALAYDNDDSWIFNALTVLSHIPESYNILKKYAVLPNHRKKLELFFTIADHYKTLQRPLIDENYNAIATAIINLLESQPVGKVVEPMQLFFHLLPEVRLCELRHLCMFLHSVCSQKQVKLAHKGSNQAIVIDTFAPCILQLGESRSLDCGMDGVKGFIRFMIHHHLRIFMLPASIEMIIQRKIDLLEQGDIESPSVLPDATYCPLITAEEYKQQKVQFTKIEVFNLYRDIEDSSIPPKKKKDLLKKFQRQHPEIFEMVNTEPGTPSILAGKRSERKKSRDEKSRFHLARSKSILSEKIPKISISKRPSTLDHSVPVSLLSSRARTAPLPRKCRTSTNDGEIFV